MNLMTKGFYRCEKKTRNRGQRICALPGVLGFGLNLGFGVGCGNTCSRGGSGLT